MSVTQNVSLQTQVELLDRLTTAVGNMNIDEDAAPADPHLTVQPCSDSGSFDKTGLKDRMFIRSSKRTW